MKKIKILAPALLSIAACGAIVAGSTYALFTSEAKTNIAITSGKVDVKASIVDGADGLTLTHKEANASGEYEEKTGLYSGSASLDEATQTLTIDKMVPMDKVSFNIKIKNESNVSVKYRTIVKIEEDDGLSKSLTITIDGSAFKKRAVTKYQTLDVGSADQIVPVEIELPEDSGNAYMGKSCKLSYSVEAVQGNALVYDDVYADSLEAAFNLTSGTFDFGTTNSEALTLDGKGRTFINAWVDGWISADTTIKNVEFLNGAAFTMKSNDVNVTFENCTFYACDQSKLTYTISNSLTNSGAGMCLNLEKQAATGVNYTIKGCTFVGEDDESLPVYGNKYNADGTVADKYKKRGYAIALDAIAGGDSSNGSLASVNIEDCEISGVRGNAIQLHGKTGAITIKDTKINSWGVNSGSYIDASGATKDGNSAAIRGDYDAGGTRRINLENVYFGLDEGANGTKGNILTHVYVGSYGGNTSTNDTGTRVAGTYSYEDANA